MGKVFSKRLCYLQICGPIPCPHQKETSPDAVVAADTLTCTRGSTVSCVWYRSGSFFLCPWAKDSWHRSVRRSVRSLDIFHSVVGIVVRHLSCTSETESFRTTLEEIFFSFFLSLFFFFLPPRFSFSFFFFLIPCVLLSTNKDHNCVHTKVYTQAEHSISFVGCWPESLCLCSWCPLTFFFLTLVLLLSWWSCSRVRLIWSEYKSGEGELAT